MKNIHINKKIYVKFRNIFVFLEEYLPYQTQFLSVCQFVYQSVCLSVSPSNLSFCLSVGRSVGWSLQIKNVFRRFMSSLFSSQESRQLNKTHCICEKKSKKLKKKAENVLIGASSFCYLFTLLSVLISSFPSFFLFFFP